MEDVLVPFFYSPGAGILKSNANGKLSVATPGDIISMVYPVGSILITTYATNPGAIFGVGTWVAFGTGRTLVGIDAGDVDFDTVEETGGAKTAAISAHAGSAVADHASHTHSVTSNVAVADHANHTHGVTSNVAVADHASHTHDIASSIATPDLFTSSAAGSAVSGRTGGPSATLTHAVTNNPVTSGGPSAALAHSVTNNAVTSGGPSAALSHAVTQPDDHDDVSVVQPYIVVHFWHRVA